MGCLNHAVREAGRHCRRHCGSGVSHRLHAASLVTALVLALAASSAHALEPLSIPRFVQDFFSHSTPGYLGVYVRDLPSGSEVSKRGSKPETGVEVVAVDHDAPAGKAGIEVDDKILAMNGHKIKNSAQFKSMMLEQPAGSTVKLLIERKGRKLGVSVRLANRSLLEQRAWGNHYSVPDPASQSPEGEGSAGQTFVVASAVSAQSFHTVVPNPLYVGVDLSPVRAQLADFFGVTGGTGLLVESVASDSPGARAGLKAGDVILRVDSAVMNTPDDWARAIRQNQGKMVKVGIMRDKRERTLVMAAGSSRAGK